MKRDPRSGSALIEFAFSLMMLSAMFTGIFQVGFTFYSYNAVVNAVSAGSRYASLQPAGSADPEFAKSVRNMVVYGDPAPAEGAKPIVRGLTPEHVTLILTPTTATVAIRDFEIDALFSKVKLDGRPTVTFPIRGQAVKE
jgi:Flp pilus assembly protein TadG